MGSASVASGETRTISLYQIHTKERLTVTYMVNGRYVPSAMKKINHLLRDWRRNETIAIDPKTIDLVWELHADLGSKAPIGIVSGYRSPKTNAFLKRIGRKVANKSQHMRGKAIDFFFSDVPTKKIRNVALAHRMGGVGYYSSAGGPTGFIHADSGRVRQWGPGMRGSQVASYVQDGQKYVGKRHGKKLWSSTQVASSGNDGKSGGLLGLLIGESKTPAQTPEQAESTATTPLEEAYRGMEDDMADLSADVAAAQAAGGEGKQKTKAPTPIAEPEYLAEMEIGSGEMAALAHSAAGEEYSADSGNRRLPRPRLKPAELKSVHVVPVSAAPENQNFVKRPSQIAALGSLTAPNGSIEGPLEYAVSAVADGNQDGKASAEIPLDYGESAALAEDGITISRAGLDDAGAALLSWLPADFVADLRRDGLLPGAEDMKRDIIPAAAVLGLDGTGPATSLDVQSDTAGKSDQEVNYEGKGNLPEKALRLSWRSGADATSLQ